MWKEENNSIAAPHRFLSRSGAEKHIRTKLLKENNIDAVIGLPAKLFYSTSIPVCILVLKKCKKFDDVLFINAEEHFEKGKRQNFLLDEHIDSIVGTYKTRTDKERYSCKVPKEEIIQNDYNLNISRYVSTAEPQPIVDLRAVNNDLKKVNKLITEKTAEHNNPIFLLD